MYAATVLTQATLCAGSLRRVLLRPGVPSEPASCLHACFALCGTDAGCGTGRCCKWYPYFLENWLFRYLPPYSSVPPSATLSTALRNPSHLLPHPFVSFSAALRPSLRNPSAPKTRHPGLRRAAVCSTPELASAGALSPRDAGMRCAVLSERGVRAGCGFTGGEYGGSACAPAEEWAWTNEFQCPGTSTALPRALLRHARYG